MKIRKTIFNNSYFLSIILLSFTGCSNHNPFVPENEYAYSMEPAYRIPVQTPRRSENMYKATMKPYCVGGVEYCPSAVRTGEKFRGIASWYGPNFHGAQTSNGEYYNMYDYTAAHKTLPINTMVKVTNLKNGKSTIVRINDRGPFVKDRIIDLSYQAAQDIGVIKHGTAKVELEVISFDQTANKYAKVPKLKPVTIPLTPVAKSTTPEVSSPPPPATRTGKEGFSIQIASFSDQQKALNFKRKCYNLAAEHPIQIKRKKISDKSIYRILISGFCSIDEAKHFMTTYKYKDAFVVKD